MDKHAVQANLAKRYQSAYAVAKEIGGIARLVLCAGLIASIGVSHLLSEPNSFTHSTPNMGFAVGSAILCFVMFYILSAIVSAVGQILLATLDTAVNTSNLLTEDQRAQIMRLD